MDPMFTGRWSPTSPFFACLTIPDARKMAGHFLEAATSMWLDVGVLACTCVVWPRLDWVIPSVLSASSIKEKIVTLITELMAGIVFRITFYPRNQITKVLLPEQVIHDQFGREDHVMVQMHIDRCVR